jgi:hypothetical protein
MGRKQREFAEDALVARLGCAQSAHTKKVAAHTFNGLGQGLDLPGWVGLRSRGGPLDGPVAGWVLNARGPVRRALRSGRHSRFGKRPVGWKRRHGEGLALWCAGAREAAVDQWLGDC